MDYGLTHARERGFSLIELMVVVAVVAILAVMAAPSLRDLVQRTKVKGAADAAAALVAEARVGAVKARRDVTINLTGLGMTWCVGANAAAAPTPGNQFGPSTTCVCTNTTACTVGLDRLVLDSADHTGVSVSGAANVNIDGKLGMLKPSGPTSLPAIANLATFSWPGSGYSLTVRVSTGGQAEACTSGASAIGGYPPCA